MTEHFIGFLISSKLIYLVDCLKAYGRFDFDF